MQKRVQLIYDAKSGAVLGTHTTRAGGGRRRDGPALGLAAADGRPAGPSRAWELALLDADEELADPQRPLRVDLATGEIAAGWALTLSAPRTGAR